MLKEIVGQERIYEGSDSDDNQSDTDGPFERDSGFKMQIDCTFK